MHRFRLLLIASMFGCSVDPSTHLSQSTVSLCEGVRCPAIATCPDGSRPRLEAGQCCETCPGGDPSGGGRCDPAFGLCQTDRDCPQVAGAPVGISCQNGCCVPRPIEPNPCGRSTLPCPAGQVPIVRDGRCECVEPPLPGRCCDGTFGQCRSADECPAFGSNIPVGCIDGCCVPLPPPCPAGDPNCGCVCPPEPPCPSGQSCPPPRPCDCPPPPCDPNDPTCRCVCPLEPCVISSDGRLICPPCDCPPCRAGDPSCPPPPCPSTDPNCPPPPCRPGDPGCPPPPPPPCDPATNPNCPRPLAGGTSR
ncbi:MAG TPA: hypothetical protein VKN99_25430 [Polyangia bacterium]|nr:hypothetical protein [Polyangia bacterium]